MANVTLDSQTFFTFPVAADQKSTSPNLWARDGDPSVASSRGPNTPQHDTHDPQRGTSGTSQDDAVLISSDDESDYSDLDDDESDFSFPSVGELLRAAGRKDTEPGGIAGVDKSFSATPGAGGNKDAVEPSVTEGSNPDDQVTSRQQQQRPARVPERGAPTDDTGVRRPGDRRGQQDTRASPSRPVHPRGCQGQLLRVCRGGPAHAHEGTLWNAPAQPRRSGRDAPFCQVLRLAPLQPPGGLPADAKKGAPTQHPRRQAPPLAAAGAGYVHRNRVRVHRGRREQRGGSREGGQIPVARRLLLLPAAVGQKLEERCPDRSLRHRGAWLLWLAEALLQPSFR